MKLQHGLIKVMRAQPGPIKLMNRLRGLMIPNPISSLPTRPGAVHGGFNPLKGSSAWVRANVADNGSHSG